MHSCILSLLYQILAKESNICWREGDILKSKIIDIILCTSIIILFIIYFVILKNTSKGIDGLFNQTEQFILDEKWDEAEKNTELIVQKWKKQNFITIINYGEQDLFMMSAKINELTGGVKTKDDTMALSGLLFIKEKWEDILRIVPEL